MAILAIIQVSKEIGSMRVANSILLVAAFAAAVSFAQTESSDAPRNPTYTQAVDAFVATEMAHHHIPGVAVGVYSRGKILLAKGYGLANVELNVPVRPETLFESGSVGKQFVAAAVMMLVQDGKLSLDDSITKYFADAPKTWKPILIKNLLSHTSGLQDYTTSDLTGQTGPFYLRLDFTEDQLLSKIEALPTQWAPGEKWAYSNTNYVLLGFLIHRVTGMLNAEFLNKRIFKPLDMTSTRLISQKPLLAVRRSIPHPVA
jgi:CubicO group peptidase (beta-lactamase class C family)